MIKILPPNKKVLKKIKLFGLEKKFNKQLKIFSQNPNHPSLHTELLEPKKFGIYSFRIDRKFRGLFIFREDKSAVEMINITCHYQ